MPWILYTRPLTHLLISYTGECHYSAVQFNMILHMVRQWLRKNTNQRLFSQKTHQSSPVRASYGVSFEDLEQNWPSYNGTTLHSTLRIHHSWAGLDIKRLAYMPVGHVVLKIYMPCKNLYVPSQYLYKPCKAYVYCWENKYMPRLKNHLPSWARNHKSLGALGQDLRAPGMRARLNVKPCWVVSIDHWSHAQNMII